MSHAIEGFPVLSARELSVHRGGSSILRSIDLEVRAGEVHGLIGPNGVGKSTLLRALARIVKPASGAVMVAQDGADLIDIARMRARERAKVLAFLPQETPLTLDFTARDLVSMGRYAHLPRWSAPKPGDGDIVDQAMARAGVSDLAQRSARTLSGGQRQLVMLAKQLAQQPSAYLLDEPVSALDLAHQLHVMTLMRDVAADSRAVLAVLHDITLASRVCDRLTVLHDGHVYATGTPEEVATEEMLAEVYRVRARVHPDSVDGVSVTPLYPINPHDHREKRAS